MIDVLQWVAIAGLVAWTIWLAYWLNRTQRALLKVITAYEAVVNALEHATPPIDTYENWKQSDPEGWARMEAYYAEQDKDREE